MERQYLMRHGWQRVAAAALSCLLLVSLSIAFLDRPISTWSHDVLHRPGWSTVVVGVAGVRNILALCLLALVVLGAVYWRRGSLTYGGRTTLEAIAATLLATASVFVLKYAFGRLWPETWLRPPNLSWITNHAYAFSPFHGGAANDSFPSGHTSRISAPFAVLWQRLPRWRGLVLLPPVLVIAGLIAADFHFLGDCVAGIYVGVTAAAISIAIFSKL